jgi:hypothetical protein
LGGQVLCKKYLPIPPTDISAGIVEIKNIIGRRKCDEYDPPYISPVVAIDFLQHWPTYSKDPMSAVKYCSSQPSFHFLGRYIPKIGKWISLILVVVAFGWLLVPFFAGGNVVDNSGRGIVGISFFYTITRLLRATQR